MPGPLDDARLNAIEACLNAGRFDEAQRLLAALAAVGGLGPGVAYLSARLLFHRGRLDAASVAARLRDVLRERPDFAEARTWLETVERSEAATEPPPSLETPRIPSAELSLEFEPRNEMPTLGPLELVPRDEMPTLGPLELPRSEQPTEPAPPPDSDSDQTPLHLDAATKRRGPWDPLEAELSGGRRDAVAGALDKLAASALDGWLAQQKPELSALAQEVARFFAVTPIFRTFAPFDLSLDSVERLDAVVALLVPPGITGGCYALRVFLSVYLGECVRAATGGRWHGTLAEPESASVEKDSGSYLPWVRVAEALGEGRSLRKTAGPPPHPAAEPSEDAPEVSAETPTPWDPRSWPSLAEAQELTRSISSSTLGVWAARCAKKTLDRTPASLAALDKYATLLNPRGKDPGAAQSWVRYAAVLAGCYLGELLGLHGGGRFVENDAVLLGPLRFEVLLPDGRAVYPLLFAYERLSGKKPETFVRFFEASLGR